MHDSLHRLRPGAQVPTLAIETVGGQPFELNADPPDGFTLLSFYRGAHCPKCRAHLQDLNANADKLEALGVEIFAASCDTLERAEQTADTWKVDRLGLGYALPPAKAQEWGLYLSRRIGKTSLGIEEPDIFCEPGLFLVRPDGSLYFSIVQTMPFVRPPVAQLVEAIGYVREHDYPARGDVADPA